MMPPGPAGCLGDLARAMLGPGIAVAARDPRLDQPGLLAGEAAAVAGARPPRRREFAAGRAAARDALAALGRPACAIPSGPDRAPIWPGDLAGSITHDAETCLAAVAPRSRVRALGIDVEPDLPLGPELWDTICTAAELRWLARQLPERRPRLARLLFSAKEAAYKAQYPVTRCLIGFESLSVAFDRGTFLARFEHAVGPFRAGDGISGRFRLGFGRLLTAALLAP